jgi:hypothetical protein
MGQLSWILLQASLANLVFFVSVLVAALPVTGSAGSVANNNNEGTVCLPLSKYNEISKGGTQDLKSAGSKVKTIITVNPSWRRFDPGVHVCRSNCFPCLHRLRISQNMPCYMKRLSNLATTS